MLKDKKALTVEVSERFHNDVKMVALKNKKTVKQIVIEALVNYINAQRDKDEPIKDFSNQI